MQQNINRAQQLQERMLDFAAQTIKAVSAANVARSVQDQITRSVTSVGANYCEAINASSKTDFRNKIYIAKKEAAETKYWLQLIRRLDENTDTNELLAECQHLLMILQKTVNTINETRSK